MALFIALHTHLHTHTGYISMNMNSLLQILTTKNTITATEAASTTLIVFVHKCIMGKITMQQIFFLLLLMFYFQS